MKRIQVSQPSLSDLERRYVGEAVASGWISSTGAFVDRFEQQFGRLTGAKHNIPVTNGTVALHLALLSANVKADDEVIVPSLTYVATANSVLYVNARPVFVDVDPATWCMDAGAVERAITPKTRAIIAVHLYGHPADMDALRALADARNIVLIEDAAEGTCATYKGRPTGDLGHVSTFSFYGNKVLTAGEGGAVCTSDDELAATMRLLKGQGMDPKRRYYFPVVGYNYRMTNLACAVVCAQIERSDELLAARHRVYARYDGHLRNLPGIGLQPKADWATIAPWLYCITVDTPGAREKLVAHLDRAGVETRPFFIPIHTLPAFTSFAPSEDMPHTARLAASGLNLPTYPDMTDADVDYVCEQIRSFKP